VHRIRLLISRGGGQCDGSNTYGSVDPAPPFTLEERDLDVSQLEALLLDESSSMFERYRAMFTLRDIGGSKSVFALARGMTKFGFLSSAVALSISLSSLVTKRRAVSLACAVVTICNFYRHVIMAKTNVMIKTDSRVYRQWKQRVTAPLIEWLAEPLRDIE